MSKKLVLVTGVNSFIGSHVALELLQKGYRVRGTAREQKVQLLKEKVNLPGLEFVQVEDVAESDLTMAVKDVFAIIHVASPLPGRATPEQMVKAAEQGTTHVLEAAVKAGIEKVVVTSSIVTIMDPLCTQALDGLEFNGSEWSKVSKKDVKEHEENTFYVYSASKTFAERAVWDYAKKHPKLDIATVLPAFVYGPYAEHFPTPPTPESLGSNSYIWELITGKQPQAVPVVVDVRDVARAHVSAINVPPSNAAALGEKRYLLVGGIITWPEAARLLKKTLPDLEVMNPEEMDAIPKKLSTYNVRKAEKDLGISWITPQDSVVAAAESLREAAKNWSRK